MPQLQFSFWRSAPAKFLPNLSCLLFRPLLFISPSPHHLRRLLLWISPLHIDSSAFRCFWLSWYRSGVLQRLVFSVVDVADAIQEFFTQSNGRMRLESR
ncbi:uncharacterized protein UBRO_20783 [Ustilago bromivora]|uniref:Uncharacterized protein n=1 Tax=Ustilago bromivora TaxID=307758 RepID=A0A1K0HGM8_9BASI|nr:uncharacterized protein UBRO_20783 [Ustilago bromivora]